MLPIFLKILPFFGLIGLGYGAAITGFFAREAGVYLTKFVFYFALSAMLFNFTATLELSQILNIEFLLCYALASIVVYIIATAVGLFRGQSAAVTAVEAQCAVIGNVGFLAIPMLISLLGPQAAAPVIMVLTVDLILFGSLIVMIITGSSEGKISPKLFKIIGRGLLSNPMIMAMLAGLAWSGSGIPLPVPLAEFMTILGSAATPCALFAIGASLAGKSAERINVTLWLSSCKLILHPLAVAFCVLFVFDLDPFAGGVMIVASAMPVAGNVFIVAQHYGVAPQRASSSILVSTLISVVTLSAVIAYVFP